MNYDPPPTGPESALPALGPLRDDVPPLPREVVQQPRIDPETSQKIRSICLVLSVAVVFNHAITFDHVWDWQGYRTEPLTPGYFSSAPFEVLIQHFVSGALGRITNPVFFLVSGYLFFYAWKPDLASWKRKLRRRAFTLLAPYFVWAFAGMAMNYLNFVAFNWRVFFDPEMRGPYGTIDVLLFFFNMRAPTQLWFLRDLILIMVLAVPALTLIVRMKPVLFVPVLLAAYLLTWRMFVFDKNGFCFFTLGAYLGYRQFNPHFPSRGWRWAAIALWMTTAALYTSLAIATDWNLQVLFKGVVLTGIAGIWASYDELAGPVRRFLDRVSPHRFFVYMGFDPLLPMLQRPFLDALPATEWARLGTYFAVPIVVSAICVAVAAVLLRISPGVYFVITGGRLPPAMDRIAKLAERRLEV